MFLFRWECAECVRLAREKCARAGRRRSAARAHEFGHEASGPCCGGYDSWRVSISKVSTVTHCYTLRHTAVCCHTLQHIVQHCNLGVKLQGLVAADMTRGV